MRRWSVIGLSCALAAGTVAVARVAGASPEAPAHKLPASKNGDLVVGLCDGETSVEVKGVKPGQPLDAAQGRQIADELMRSWRARNPQVAWASGPEKGASSTAPAGATAETGAKGAKQATPAGNVQADTYAAFGTRDEQIWRASTQQFVEKGRQIFHDANALGGTIAVSCDMCHPDGANTHPETYPKYQVQLGRVALLRDMVNWCIENPVRGKPLADDDVRLKALEAYIYAQRKGVALDYGKH